MNNKVQNFLNATWLAIKMPIYYVKHENNDCLTKHLWNEIFIIADTSECYYLAEQKNLKLQKIKGISYNLKNNKKLYGYMDGAYKGKAWPVDWKPFERWLEELYKLIPDAYLFHEKSYDGSFYSVYKFLPSDDRITIHCLNRSEGYYEINFN